MPEGTCVQAASDAVWYKCLNGSWYEGHSGCTTSYAWCYSDTLDRSVAPRTCVQVSSDGEWYQCDGLGWKQPVENGVGPAGTCSSKYPL
jgi:hypothetical protein